MPVKSQYIQTRYMDDGVYEFKFLCCGYTQESRSSPANFCPGCGTMVGDEKPRQPGSYGNFARRRAIRKLVKKGEFYRLSNDLGHKAYDFYLLGKFQRKFYGSITDAAKILKFLNENCIFTFPYWVDSFQDVLDFSDDIFDEDYDIHSKMWEIAHTDGCEDLNRLWSVKVNLPGDLNDDNA